MRSRTFFLVAAAAAPAFAAGILVGGRAPSSAEAAAPGRLFELRTYVAAEGKLEALEDRFRKHTDKLFAKHGIKSIGYWVPAEQPGTEKRFVYLLVHKDRQAADKSWSAFRADPEWQKVKSATETGGKLAAKVESLYLTPTDFSSLK
jgi:hypothetical protein